MKRHQKNLSVARHLLNLALAAGLALPLPALAASVALATSPLATSTTSTVKPNLLFILDNSGSMDWLHMPDDADDGGSAVSFNFGHYGLRSSQCNQVYYDPNTTYLAPVNADGTSFTDSSFSSAEPNGFNTSGTNVDLRSNFQAEGDSSGQAAYYYSYSGTQDTQQEKNYHSTTNTFYSECNSAQNSATGLGVFTKISLSATAAATSATIVASCSSCTSTSVSGIVVNGSQQIMSGTAAESATSSTVATNIAAQINLCTSAKVGNCTTVGGHGYTASVSGSTVTINGLAATASTLIATKGNSGTMTFASTIFPAADNAKLTNFANWYSFYRSRMLMMKTAAGHAFSSLNNSYRVGMMKISQTTPVVYLDTFEGTHRSTWYNALYNMATDGSTPLRRSLSDAGRYYAGKLSGTDPVQYSCQQNFTILSTDGYWNTGDSYKLDGTTVVDNQDGTLSRPYYDGSALGSSRSTSQRLMTQTQVRQSTSQLQQRVQETKASTSNLQRQISQLRQDVGTLQSRTSQLQTRTGTLQGALSKVLMRCNNTVAACGTAPATGIANANWSLVTSGSCTVAANVQCALVSGLSGNVNVASTCNTAASISSTPATNGSITITVTGVNSTTRLSSLKIAGVEILTGTTGGTNNQTNSNNEVATRTKEKVGNGYTATVASNVVTVTHANITAASTITYTISTGSATLTGAATSGAPASYTLNNADTNGKVYSACSYNWGGWVDSASCTANKSAASPYTITSATECQYAVPGTSTAGWSTFANAGSCTAVAQDATSPHSVGTATECQYSWANAQGTPSCSTPAYVAGNYSNATVYRNCQTTITTPWANATSCATNAVPDGSGNTTECRYTAFTAYAYANSCTDAAQDATDPFDMTATNGVATQCQITDTGWIAGDAITQRSDSTNSGASYGPWYDVASCTVDNAGTTRNQCQAISSCTPSSSTGYTRTCQTANTGPTLVSTCSSASASAANDYTTTSCATTTLLAATPVASCTDTDASAANNYVKTTCSTASSGPTTVASCTAAAASASNNWTATTCSPVVTSGGSSNNLADIAMYYYQTDLRTSTLSNCTGALGQDVCANNVFIGGNDNNSQQHMTTFTLGLGASGWMNYSSSYLNDTSGDYYDVKQGSTASASVCTWQTAGTTCNWPIPGMSSSNGLIANIDDLWHAAVNGRGAYFSATDPASLSSGLSNALAGINARKGSAAAAATSTLNPVAGNNYAYVASYTTVTWKGNLEARGINTITGAVNENATWCAENVVAGTCAAPGAVVAETIGDTTVYYCVTPDSVICTEGTLDGTDCKVPVATACTGTMNSLVADVTDSRTIKTANSTATGLVDFAYANLTPTQQAYFAAANIGTLSQWSTLTAAQKTAAAGLNLVNYLRGQYGYEDRNANPADNRLYRYREAVLGDALESQPAFISKPVFSYPYPGYDAYKTAQTSRAGTVYMGANDGMMHAFAADTGVERWAYVPSMVIPNLWKLADSGYATAHRNFANGSPITSDICTANCSNADFAATADTSDDPVWKTILVAGLNGGGRGYFALDITDPDAPALLWEFTPSTGTGSVTDDDLGYSFGQPVITRKADGTWVVLVTSGYNNTSPDNGEGYLYVLNADSGAIISKIATNVGSTTTPSGLAKIAGWNDEPAGNQAGYVYGGDLLGNVWRFDINSVVTATVADGEIGTGDVMKFAALYSDAGGTNPQPITTTPVLGKIAGKRVIFVGTGKYLETGDLTTTQTQTQYAIKDDNATTTLVNPRNSLVRQTLSNNTDGTATRITTGNAVDFYTGRGWFVDFPDSGERVNIDSKLVEGTLLVPTIVPSNTVCAPGGYGWLNFFDYKTGGAINTDTDLASLKYDATIVGVNVLYVGGVPKVGVVTSTNPTPELNENVEFPATAAGFSGKRVIWRELIP